MGSKASAGELILAALFAATGIVWIHGALGFSLWEGFAPQSGFMPLLYGVLLSGVSGAIVINLFRRRDAATIDEPIGKPLVLLAVLIVTVIGIDVIGFVPAIFLSMAFLYAVVERLPVHWSLLVAAATTVALTLVFKSWLGIPLPTGPLGI
jgi:putative tricarboxylic transport membrane protein